MLNLKKSLKLAALAVVLGAAVPAMTTAASAAPVAQHQMVRVAQNDRTDSHRDFRGDRHESRFEHRGFEHGRWHRHHEFRVHSWR